MLRIRILNTFKNLNNFKKMFYTFVTLNCKFKNVLASDRTKCLFLREYFFFKLSPTVLDFKKTQSSDTGSGSGKITWISPNPK